MKKLTLTSSYTENTITLRVEDFWKLDNSDILHIKEPGKEWYTLEVCKQKSKNNFIIW